MPVKGATLRSKLIDIWRVNVIHPETLELWSEVIDTKQQHIRPLFCNSLKRQKRHQNKNEFSHVVWRSCQKQSRLQPLTVSAKTFPDRSPRVSPIGAGRCR